MPDIYLNNLDGIPYGVNAGRPANPQPGQPYFNGEANRLEIYTQSTGWQNIVQETPAVVSITGQANQSTSSTITINGTNFGVGANVFAVGTDGVEVQATTATVVSVVEITATLPPLSPTYEPYDVKVVNPSNLYGVLYETLGVNNSPIWSTSAGTLGTFTELQAVSVTVAATDATDSTNSPLSYSVVSGALPGGLTLNSSTGVISGTATSIVSDTTYSFTIAVTDGRNTAVTRAFSITISDRGPVWSTTSPLPSFTRNASYSTTLSANDDDGGAISYSLLSGSLPTGLTLSSGGVISGTPTGSSPSTFTIRATSSGNTVTDRQFTIPNVGPTWVTSSIDSAVQNLAYSFQLSATDDSGVAPTYSIVTGSLPAGFSMNSSGLITGSSASQSSTSITFRATDANSTTSDRTLTFTVAPPPIGGTLYQTPGSYTFTVPANVYSLSVVAIGGGQGGGGSANSSTSVSSGGGAGGGLSYGNNISVTPGQTYSVVVGSGGAGGAGNQNGGSAGGPSSFASLVVAGGGSGTTVGGQPNPSTGSSGTGGTSGGTARSGGGTGGAGGGGSQGDGAGGGGGAGGYAGNGGLGGGAGTDGLPTTAATAGSGGAGGGGSGGPGGNDQAGYGGGGVGVYGQGSNGAAGNGGAIAGVSASIGTAGQGGGGSGGGNGGGSGGDSPGNGGSFGGGGGGGNGNSDVQSGGSGAGGAVRIIWGLNRSFPSTNVGQNYNGVTETVI